MVVKSLWSVEVPCTMCVTNQILLYHMYHMYHMYKMYHMCHMCNWFAKRLSSCFSSECVKCLLADIWHLLCAACILCPGSWTNGKFVSNMSNGKFVSNMSNGKWQICVMSELNICLMYFLFTLSSWSVLVDSEVKCLPYLPYRPYMPYLPYRLYRPYLPYRPYMPYLPYRLYMPYLPYRLYMPYRPWLTWSPWVCSE